MAVDREKRMVIANALAALMRGEIGFAAIDAIRARPWPRPGDPMRDLLAEFSLDERLGAIFPVMKQRGAFQVTYAEWEAMRRWIAVLHTDVDWELRPLKARPGCLNQLWEVVPFFATIGLMITSSIVFDGTLLLWWIGIGCVAGPAFALYLSLFNKQPTESVARYPFLSRRMLEESMHLADACGLPQYDPATHGISSATKVWTALTRLPIVIVMIAFFSAMWPMLLFMFPLHSSGSDAAESRGGALYDANKFDIDDQAA